DAQASVDERSLETRLDRVEALRVERRLHGRRVEAARLVHAGDTHVIERAGTRRELRAELRGQRAPRALLALRSNRDAGRARHGPDEIDTALVLVPAQSRPRTPLADPIPELAEHRARRRVDPCIRVA